MREEFEEWYLRDVFGGSKACRHYLRRESCGGYLHASPQAFWNCWQSSREALVIELPSFSGMNSSFVADGIQKTREHNRYNEAVNGCRKAIHATGVKTK